MPAAALRADAIWGGDFAPYEQNPPPKYLEEKSEFAHCNLIIPKSIISAFATKPQ